MNKRSLFAHALGAVSTLALAACGPPGGTPQTYNFNRPSDIALVCLRVPIASDGRIDPPNTTVTPLPLVDCSTTDPGAMNVDSAMPGTARRLFGLVTQNDRGELAVVNLHGSIGTGIVDNNRQIPGYTFIPVGAYPGSVVVDPRGGATYVANNAEPSITVIDNRALLTSNGHRLARIDTQASPYDVVVANGPAERVFLYVTVPDRGEVQVYDVTDPANARRTFSLALQGSTAMSGSGADGGGLDAGLDAGAEGGVDGGSPDAMAAMDGGGAGEGGTLRASPRELVRGDDGRFYVADAVAPIVHVLEVVEDGSMVRLRELAPLRSNEPTRTLVVTPAVPTNPPTPSYVYAISAVDQSLMVLDVTSGARLRVNAVPGRAECTDEAFARDPYRCPRIDPRQAHDRVPLLAPAAALTVIDRDARGQVTVGSRTSNCGPTVNPLTSCTCVPTATAQPGVNCSTPPTDLQPAVDVLRGIQVAVALRTGQLQIVDVLDPDGTCTARRAQNGASAIDTRAYRNVLRHGGLVSDPPGLVASPQLLLNGTPVAAPTNVAADYISDQPEIAPTVAIDPANPASIDDATLCSDANNYCVAVPLLPGASSGAVGGRPPIDPLAVADETWALTYEGVLPGLAFDGVGLRANSDSPTGLVVEAAGASLCTRGVLDGDRVVVTALSNWVHDETIDAGLEPPTPPGEGTDYPARTEEFCRNVFGTLTSTCNRELRVTRATNSRLTLEVLPATGCGTATALSGEELRNAFLRCYPENTPIEVRANDAYVVQGSRSGYLHDVVVGAGGACVRDPSRFPAGRLREDRGDRSIYQGTAFSVRVRAGRARSETGVITFRPTPRGSSFQFRIYGGFSALTLGTPAPLPSALHYNCETQRVYLLDQGRNTLFEYGAAPVGRDPRVLN